MSLYLQAIENPSTPRAILLKRLVFGLYFSLVTALLYWLFSNWGYDDPFITYRYAGNLASGLGLVYNPGERVLSTTTPLFTLLLTPFALLSVDLPRLAVLIGAISIAAGSYCLWELGRAWQAPAVGWAGLLLYPIFPLLASTLSSETPLYLALCLGAFALYAQRRLTLAAACSALAVLARPDGALVPFLLGAHYLGSTWLQAYRESKDALPQKRWGGVVRCLWSSIPWRAVLVFLALTLPWFLFAWGYYGSPLPVTLNAKQQQGVMAISQRFTEGFLNLASGYAKNWLYRVEALLGLLGVAYALFKDRRWLLLLAWTALYFTAYSLLRVSSYFWYYAPLVPGFIVAAGLGLQGIRSWVEALVKRPAPAVAVAAVVLLPLFAAHLPRQVRQATFLDQRLEAYRAVGTWLRENTPSGTRVGALEVGIIGYYAQRPMIDFAGLIQPRVSRQFKQQATYEDSALWAMEAYQPEYLVLHQGLFPRLEQYAEERCRPVQRFPGLQYNYSVDLQIYTCSSSG